MGLRLLLAGAQVVLLFVKFFGVFVHFAQNLALYLKSKTGFVITLLSVLVLGYAVFYVYATGGFLLYVGVIFVVTLLMVGLNSIQASLDKAQEKSVNKVEDIKSKIANKDGK